MSAPRDRLKLATAFTAPEPGVRIRFGRCTAVDAGTRTCTVTIAGSATPIASVKYLTAPIVGVDCMIMTDGADMFVLGQFASPTVAPSPGPTMRKSAGTQNFSTATAAAVIMDTAENDPDGCWSAAAPTILTIKKAGRYLFTAGGNISGPTTPANTRRFYIVKNSATTLCMEQRAPSTISGQAIAAVLSSPVTACVVGDTIALWQYQNQTATLALDAAVAPVFLSAAWVGE